MRPFSTALCSVIGITALLACSAMESVTPQMSAINLDQIVVTEVGDQIVVTEVGKVWRCRIGRVPEGLERPVPGL